MLSTLWHLLPTITAMLKFCTALIGFVIAVLLLISRTRGWMRRRRQRQGGNKCR